MREPSIIEFFWKPWDKAGEQPEHSDSDRLMLEIFFSYHMAKEMALKEEAALFLKKKAAMQKEGEHSLMVISLIPFSDLLQPQYHSKEFTVITSSCILFLFFC